MKITSGAAFLSICLLAAAPLRAQDDSASQKKLNDLIQSAKTLKGSMPAPKTVPGYDMEKRCYIPGEHTPTVPQRDPLGSDMCTRDPLPGPDSQRVAAEVLAQKIEKNGAPFVAHQHVPYLELENDTRGKVLEDGTPDHHAIDAENFWGDKAAITYREDGSVDRIIISTYRLHSAYPGRTDQYKDYYKAMRLDFYADAKSGKLEIIEAFSGERNPGTRGETIWVGESKPGPGDPGRPMDRHFMFNHDNLPEIYAMRWRDLLLYWANKN